MKYLMFFVLFFNLTACYTIHFVKGNYRPASYTHSFWHHIGLLGLVEWSKPVHVRSICRSFGNWKSVRTQTGFLQWLVRNISVPIGSYPVYYSYDMDPVLVPYVIGIGTFYSPEKVSVACGEK